MLNRPRKFQNFLSRFTVDGRIIEIFKTVTFLKGVAVC